MSRRSLKITVEMSFLIHHQRRKILTEPIRILIHISINTQFQSCLYGLERNIPLIFQCNLHGRLPFPFFISKAALHTVDGCAIRTVTIRYPIRFYIPIAHVGIKTGARITLIMEKRYRIITLTTFKNNLLQCPFIRDATFPTAAFPYCSLCKSAHSP